MTEVIGQSDRLTGQKTAGAVSIRWGGVLIGASVVLLLPVFGVIAVLPVDIACRQQLGAVQIEQPFQIAHAHAAGSNAANRDAVARGRCTQYGGGDDGRETRRRSGDG